jgi:hypothetical protein
LWDVVVEKLEKMLTTTSAVQLFPSELLEIGDFNFY